MSSSKTILQLIIDLNLTEGARLPSERELAERSGISRTSVRNALKELQSKRVLMVKKGSGYFISSLFALRRAQQGDDLKWDLNKIRNTLEARRVITDHLLGKICLNKSDTQILALQDWLIQLGKAVIDHNAEEIETLHRSFFNTIFETCSNVEFIRMLNEVRIPSPLLSRALSLSDGDHLGIFFSNHVNLLQSIKTNNLTALLTACDQMHSSLLGIFQLLFHNETLQMDIGKPA